MANPLPNEKELYERIKSENIVINPDIWDLLYNRIGDDLTNINLLCQYYLKNNEPIPVEEAKKILRYTRHIKDINNKITVVKVEDLYFPEFGNDLPLHSVLREMLTHYIGNDVYMINLIVGDAISPLEPEELSLGSIQKILEHTRSIRIFMNRLREATMQEKVPSVASGASEDNKEAEPHKIKKELTKEETFLRIRKRLTQEFKSIKEENLRLESRFNEDLRLDSVDAIQVVMVLEEEFGFEIPDEEAEKAFTVSQAVDYIYERLKRCV